MWGWIVAIAAAVVCGGAAVYTVMKIKSNSTFISLEDTIGEKCTVVETVDNYAGCGLVKVKGQVWSARGVDDDDVFRAGETLYVVAIEGVKLICKKK